MFEASARRHPVQTFQFWFIVLSSFVVVTAWKLDFFDFSRQELPVVSDEEMPPPPAGHERLDDVPRESAPPQSDDVIRDVQAQLTTILPGHVELQPPPAPLQSEHVRPADEQKIVQTAALESPQGRPAVMQALAEEIVAADSPVEHDSNPEQTNREMIDFAEVDQLIADGKDVPALRMLSQWHWQRPEWRPQLKGRLQGLSRRVYFSSSPHYLPPHRVQFAESLSGIAAKYQLTPEYLAKLNRVDPSALKATQTLKVLQGPFSAVADVSDFELTIHAHGYFVTSFPIGFGTDQSVPEGTFFVTEKNLKSGPNGQPHQARWLTINDERQTLRNFVLHAAEDPESLGTVSGPGGMRLRPGDLEALYDLLTVGTEFIIHP